MKSNRFSSVQRIKFNNIYFDVAVTFSLTCFSLFFVHIWGEKEQKIYLFFKSKSVTSLVVDDQKVHIALEIRGSRG